MLGIAEAAERWQLTDVIEIANTPGSLVFRARQRRSRVVVKLLKPRGIGELAGTGYLAWRDGIGAVKLLAREANACLLDDAGTMTLEDVRQAKGEAAATEIFARMLRKLHEPSRHPFPDGLVPLEQHFAALLGERQSAPPGHAADLAWAADVTRHLLAHQTDVMPLHGDLHHENLLADGRGQWRAIDPHGLIGDAVYDAANFFGNPIGKPDITCDVDRIRRLVSHLAPALGCREEKVLRYAAVHAALSACWSIDDPVSDEDRSDAGHRLAFLALVRTMLA